MADGRANNGGARAGSGRKTKAEEDDLRRLLKRCVPAKDREAILRKLNEDAQSTVTKTRQEARRLLMSYLWGKPVERVEVTGEDGGPIQIRSRVIEPAAPEPAGGDGES